MKKSYTPPQFTKIDFSYSQQVVASGAAGNSCHWQNNGYWAYEAQTCKDTYMEGTSTQVPG